MSNVSQKQRVQADLTQDRGLQRGSHHQRGSHRQQEWQWVCLHSGNRQVGVPHLNTLHLTVALDKGDKHHASGPAQRLISAELAIEHDQQSILLPKQLTLQPAAAGVQLSLGLHKSRSGVLPISGDLVCKLHVKRPLLYAQGFCNPPP